MEQVLFARIHRATQKAGLIFDAGAGFPAWSGENAPGFLRSRAGSPPGRRGCPGAPPGPQQ